MMRAGNKIQFLDVNVGIGVTHIGTIPVLGARKVLIRVYGGPNTNLLTFAAGAAPDGSGVAPYGNASLSFIIDPGSIRTDNAQGAFAEIYPGPVADGATEFSCPYLRVSAAIASVGGPTDFDMWVFRDHAETHVPATLPS